MMVSDAAVLNAAVLDAASMLFLLIPATKDSLLENFRRTR
ncbi:hypothetical protein GFS31_28300 [Leptolyngbya sp. BL0902]|nr:hypothetical protein GFS31_28300 [Leptolyngbya sp. BL0902]